MDDEYIGRVIKVIKTWRRIERGWKYEKQKNFNERLNFLSAWNLELKVSYGFHLHHWTSPKYSEKMCVKRGKCSARF